MSYCLLGFGNEVLSPRLKTDKKLVEVQRRATRIISGFKDLTYEQRLEKMKLPNMCYRRLRGDLIEVFKCTHNIYNLSDSLLELQTRTNTRGHSYKLKKQRCNTTLRQHFFIHRIVERWNSLPTEFAETPSLNAFKNRIDLLMNDHLYSLEEPPISIRSGNWLWEHW